MKRERLIKLSDKQDSASNGGEGEVYRPEEKFWTGLLFEVCQKVLPAPYVSRKALSSHGNLAVFPGKRLVARQILEILMRSLRDSLKEEKPAGLEIAASQYAGQIVLEIKVERKIHLPEITDSKEIIRSIEQVLHEDNDRFALKKFMSRQHSLGISLQDSLSQVEIKK